MSLIQASIEGFLDTFKCDSHIEVRVRCWVAILLFGFLVDTVGDWTILDGSGYDMATAFMSQGSMRFIDWMDATPGSVPQLLFST